MNCTMMMFAAMMLAQTPADAPAPGSTPAPGGDPVAVARQVHAIFKAKCVECHGPDVAEPKGDFGFVLDLERVGKDEELVIAGNPEDSELYFQVEVGDMPPPNSKYGSLSPDELAIVGAWIMIGAPGLPADVQAEADAEPVVAIVDTRPFGKRLLDYLGRFHPATVHFPIALLIVAAVGEWLGILCKRPRWRDAACDCLVLGAVAAVAAAPLGWFNAMFAGYSGSSADTLLLHRWFGVGTAAWAVMTAAIVVIGRVRQSNAMRRWGAIAILIGAIVVSITGHLGGKLTHGPNLYQWPSGAGESQTME
jgi:uncharacterized membrane protein/mono/diheme cytochrome c family protein